MLIMEDVRIQVDQLKHMLSRWIQVQSLGVPSCNQLLLSTTEAEFVAACSTDAGVVWLCNLFTELGIDLSSTFSLLYIDNQSALSVAKNPEHHEYMKHLDLQFYWLRDAVDKKVMSVMYCPTDQMPADLLTKALTMVKVKECCRMLGFAPSGGSVE
jgi:hypothetical protein